jgi:hypothetical protein
LPDVSMTTDYALAGIWKDSDINIAFLCDCNFLQSEDVHCKEPIPSYNLYTILLWT